MMAILKEELSCTFFRLKYRQDSLLREIEAPCYKKKKVIKNAQLGPKSVITSSTFERRKHVVMIQTTPV